MICNYVVVEFSFCVYFLSVIFFFTESDIRNLSNKDVSVLLYVCLERSIRFYECLCQFGQF